MKRSIAALTLGAYLSMFFLGISSSMIGASARNINLTAFQIGLFLAIQNIGFMIAVVVSGALADTFEKPRILFIGSLILAFSLLGFYVSEIFWVNLAIMMMIGAGSGTYEGVTDAMLLDMHSERQSLHININHFFVTFGSILITVYLIFLQVNWRVALIQSAAVVLILALFFALVRLRNKKRQTEDYLQRIRILSRDRLVVVLFIATVLVVGVELGTVGILTTQLMDMRGFTQTTSKLGLVTFLVGIAVGRLLIGFLTRKGAVSHYILILFGLATVFFTLMFFLNLGQYAYISIFLAGVSLSALFPLIITYAGQVYENMAGTVIGSIKMAIPIGGILIPVLMSLVTRVASFQVALIVFPLALLLAFLLLWFEFRRAPNLKHPMV